MTGPVQLDELERLLGEARPERLELRFVDDDGGPFICSPGDVKAIPDLNHTQPDASDTAHFALIVAAINALPALIAELRAARERISQAKAFLDTARPAFTNLTTNQRQLDMDGVEVGVSRQAVDETVHAILHAADALLQPQESDRG